jgi:CHASE2 domain-containing sensor protein/serine phosphatase RsbU (regulator of sigma subunit)
MTDRLVATSRRARVPWRGIRSVVLLALLLVPVTWTDMPVVGAMRLAWLDAYQALSPRERRSAPAVIVAIDEKSLERFGQWPWPRTLVARLLDRISAAGPAAIGVDLLFPDPDRLSPEQLAPAIAGDNAALAARLAKLPRHDFTLAASIKAAPVVLGIAGLETARAAPGTVSFTPSLQRGGDATPFLRHYAEALRSIPDLEKSARGHGLLSADTEGGVVRRVPMVAAIGSTPVLPLSLETLRVASRNPLFTVNSDKTGVQTVDIGDLSIPTQPDGHIWVYYTPHNASRYVSAADVLAGTVDNAELERKLVLVGITALGLIDYQTTPLGERMPGVEIHAQVLENVFDGNLLSRPRWAPWAEGAAFLVFGLLVVYAVPRLTPRRSGMLLAVLLALLTGAGFLAYKTAGLLIDALVPGAALASLFAAMLAATLGEANAQRRLLRERLQREREAAAQLAGELDAARRIQLGILPKPETSFPGERRFELFALMQPAREVGGDLYDFFALDRERMFFLVGDVSGKGLPASIFMAVSKALCKSAALRRGQDVDEVLRDVGGEIARENPESLFVTAFAGVLDADTGLLRYCSAGHDAPHVISPDRSGFERLDAAGGPPLCVIDGYRYTAAQHRLRAGDTVCLVTDGVTEAMNAAGELYGHERLRGVLERVRGTASAEAVGEAIRADVARFVGDAEPADDLTLLVLRWKGP